MVCATSLTNDSFCGSIVSGSPPVLVFSSPFGSTAAALLAGLLPCPPWQAVTIIETAMSITRIDQRLERRWIIRSLQMLWRATRVGAVDELRGSPPRPNGSNRPGSWGSLRLPSLAPHARPQLNGSRVAWDRVIVWSLAAQRQLRDSRPGRSLLPR